MLILVALVEGVLWLPADDVQCSAHSVCVADHARVFPLPARLTPGSRLVLYQTFLDQTVSRRFKDVQRESLDAAFEKATLLFTFFGKTGFLLKEQSLKPKIISDRNLQILHTF